MGDESELIIAHIITGLTTGGAEMMLYKLCSAADRSRFEPVVVSLMGRDALGERIAALGVPVYTMDMGRGHPPTPAVLWRLARLVRELRPDLIQGWLAHGNLAAQVAGVFAGGRVPVVWNVRHSYRSKSDAKAQTGGIIKALAYLSRMPARIIYNSRRGAADYERIGYCAHKTVVIPNGFDVERFAPSAAARLKIRAELGLPEQAILIGLIGRFHPLKDHANFLQAAALLLKEQPEVHFVLAGRQVDEDNPLLRQWLAPPELLQHVHLLGEREDIACLTAALDIASSSSCGEGFPNVIGEAMACAVPCAVTDVGDSAWIVGSAGRVVPPRNPGALAAAWAELLDLGPDGREQLGKAARQRVLAEFSIGRVAADYESLYLQAIMSHRG